MDGNHPEPVKREPRGVWLRWWVGGAAAFLALLIGVPIGLAQDLIKNENANCNAFVQAGAVFVHGASPEGPDRERNRAVVRQARAGLDLRLIQNDPAKLTYEFLTSDLGQEGEVWLGKLEAACRPTFGLALKAAMGMSGVK